MANLTTNADILDYALDTADEPMDASSDFYSMLLVEYNRVHREICNGGASLNPELDENWYWMRSQDPGVIILQPAFVGVGAFTFNSASVTLASPLPSYSIQGWFLWVPSTGNGDFYKVSAHTAGMAAVTLDSVYTGETNAAAEVKAAKLIYDLESDCGEVIGAMRSRDNDKIEGIEPERLHEEYPLSEMTFGVPKAYAIVGEGKVRFTGPSGDETDQLVRVEYDYKFKPTDLADDSGEPLLPIQHRHVLADYLAYFLMKKKNDSRAERQGELAIAGLIAMGAENRRRQAKQGSGSFGQIRPRSPPGTRRGVLRTQSGHIITG